MFCLSCEACAFSACGVIDDCEPRCRCCELNLSPVKEQPTLLTAVRALSLFSLSLSRSHHSSGWHHSLPASAWLLLFVLPLLLSHLLTLTLYHLLSPRVREEKMDSSKLFSALWACAMACLLPQLDTIATTTKFTEMKFREIQDILRKDKLDSYTHNANQPCRNNNSREPRRPWRNLLQAGRDGHSLLFILYLSDLTVCSHTLGCGLQGRWQGRLSSLVPPAASWEVLACDLNFQLHG